MAQVAAFLGDYLHCMYCGAKTGDSNICDECQSRSDMQDDDGFEYYED